MGKVILLNIADLDVSNFIWKLQELLSNKKSNSLPHITLRGPYKRNPNSKIKTKVQNFVNNINTAQIDGVGMFANDDDFFVYLKVFIRDLETISWKKDYPIKEYGFNPHITICKTSDEQYAKKVFNFLDNLNVKVEIKNFDLEIYQLGQKQSSLLSQSLTVSDNTLKNHLMRTRRFVKTTEKRM